MNTEYIYGLKPDSSKYRSTEEQNAFLSGFNYCLKKVKSIEPLMGYRIIGITGKTGAGKTEYIKQEYLTGGFRVLDDKPLHFCVLDADVIYHNMLKDNKIHGLRDAFGDCIFDNGVVNRKKLASIVFQSQSFLERLNSVVLPQITDEIIQMMKDIVSEDAGKDYMFILDAPTLIESGLHNLCDMVVFLQTEKDIRKERIMKRDGLSEEEAFKRMSLEKPDEFYLRVADRVIVNGVVAKR